MAVSEMNRPQLITKTFDRSYVVKYLGLDTFTLYDGMKTQHNSDVRATAKKSELTDI
jgi:Phosphoglycerol transferase and related proteins, alkaline phosphatase superfamily